MFLKGREREAGENVIKHFTSQSGGREREREKDALTVDGEKRWKDPFARIHRERVDLAEETLFGTYTLEAKVIAVDKVGHAVERERGEEGRGESHERLDSCAMCQVVVCGCAFT